MQSSCNHQKVELYKTAMYQGRIQSGTLRRPLHPPPHMSEEQKALRVLYVFKGLAYQEQSISMPCTPGETVRAEGSIAVAEGLGLG
jgi:hypothetical protein